MLIIPNHVYNKLMRKITLFLFVLFSTTFYAQWMQQNSGVSTNLTDVYCISDEIVVVVGDGGIILKTTNGGTNWLQKLSGTTANLTKVQFPSANVGYAVGSGGILLKTIDGGENWTSLILENISFVADISCINENISFITTNNGLKRTENGGISFETINPTTDFIEIQFLNQQIGYASFYSDFQYNLSKTNNGGISWTNVSTDFNQGKFYFLDENHGFINKLGQNFKTIDSCENLTSMPNSDGETRDMFSLNENVLWEVKGLILLCGCPPSYCISKSDLNEIEENQELKNCDFGNGLDLMLNSLHFSSETKGYTVGFLSYTGIFGPPLYMGAIFKNSTGTMLNLDKIVKSPEIKIFPNPTSVKITVSLNKMPSKPFIISINDSLGKKIYSNVFSAESEININTSSFAKGLYFVTIGIDENRQNQKMIIN